MNELFNYPQLSSDHSSARWDYLAQDALEVWL
jgi:hypothetical protein